MTSPPYVQAPYPVTPPPLLTHILSLLTTAPIPNRLTLHPLSSGSSACEGDGDNGDGNSTCSVEMLAMKAEEPGGVVTLAVCFEAFPHILSVLKGYHSSCKRQSEDPISTAASSMLTLLLLPRRGDSYAFRDAMCDHFRSDRKALLRFLQGEETLTRLAITSDPKSSLCWFYRRKVRRLFWETAGFEGGASAAAMSDAQEREFCDNVARQSPRNYYCWYHRTALLERFITAEGGGTAGSQELDYVMSHLRSNPRDNTAVSHLWNLFNRSPAACASDSTLRLSLSQLLSTYETAETWALSSASALTNSGHWSLVRCLLMCLREASLHHYNLVIKKWYDFVTAQPQSVALPDSAYRTLAWISYRFKHDRLFQASKRHLIASNHDKHRFLKNFNLGE